MERLAERGFSSPLRAEPTVGNLRSTRSRGKSLALVDAPDVTFDSLSLSLSADVNFIATSMRTPTRRVQYTRNDTNNALYSFPRSMLRIFFSVFLSLSPSRRGRARIREIVERRSCEYVCPPSPSHNTHARADSRPCNAHLVTPPRHIFDFRALCVHARTLSSEYYHACANERAGVKERKGKG